MNREESIIFAKKYVEDILSFFGLNVDVYAGADEDVIEINVPSTHMNAFLIGQKGETLKNLQFLVSATLRSKEAELVRVSLDVASYKQQRKDRLRVQAEEWIKEVKQSGEPKVLYLNSSDRWVVHNVASEYSDITTHSEGEGRDRRLIISQSES